MAKKSKSTKKNKKLNSIIFYAIALLLGALAVAMIFANVCGIQNENNMAYELTGIQATFGYSEQTKLLGTLYYTNFSILNLLVYVLLIAGVMLTILKMFKVIKSGTFDYVIVALFVVAGILYFMVPNFVVYGNDWSTAVNIALKAGGAKVVLAGGIVGGISSILAAVSIIAGKFLAKK